MTTAGYCFICGKWSSHRRQICKAKGGEYIICWLCDECDIVEV